MTKTTRRNFCCYNIQKEGGDDESASASSYYEQLTREEADCIIGEFIKKALGIEDFELETDSDDLIEENEIFLSHRPDVAEFPIPFHFVSQK